MEQEPTKTVQIILPPVGEMPAPEGVNYFHFTASGPDVQMLVGYIDLRSVADAKEGEGVLIPAIQHRFVLTQVGFAHLRSQLAEIVRIHQPFNTKTDA